MNSNLNNIVTDNFKNVTNNYLIPPFVVLLLCYFLFLFLGNGQNFIDTYVKIQTDFFFYLNSNLSAFPDIQYNLTQLGDVVILFPFVCIFVLYAPKIWETILISSVLSLIVSAVLKNLFNVPRPAAVFDVESFTIIGRTLTGRTSLPSGHSMTAFIVIAILLFAFMPKNTWQKLFWYIAVLAIGLLITISRVGVGAHYPLDVLIGSTIGYILAIIGIKLHVKKNWASKFNIKKRLIILMIILVFWMGVIIHKIVTTDLIISYLSLIFLIITLYLTFKKYVQEKN